MSDEEFYRVTEQVFARYPDDQDIWLMLQYMIGLSQTVRKIVEDLYEPTKPLTAEVNEAVLGGGEGG